VIEGVTQIKLSGGDAGKSKGQIKASNLNGALALGTAAALAGDMSATIQMRTTAGMCMSSTLGTVTKNADGKFQAKK